MTRIKKISSIRRIEEQKQQLTIDDMFVKFTCPISMVVFSSKIEHARRCRYRYCKGGWHF